MIARLTRWLARWLGGLAHRLGYRRELTEDELITIAEIALEAELKTEVRAPELRIWVESPRRGSPGMRPTNARDLEEH